MLLVSMLLATAAIPAPELEWFDGPLTSAVGQAHNTERSVLVYFWRNGSDHCASFYADTLQNERVHGALQDYVLLSANYDNQAGAELFSKFRVSTLPTIIVLKDGQPEDMLGGFLETDGFLGELERIGRGEGTVSGLTRAVEEAEGEAALDARFTLAGKYFDLGQQERHDALLDEIRELDPEGETDTGVTAHIWRLRDGITADVVALSLEGAEDSQLEEARKAMDVSPLVAFAKQVKKPESRYEVWKAVGEMEVRREDEERATKAFATAWKTVPEEKAIPFASSVAGWVLDGIEEPKGKTAKLGLQMAEACVEHIEKLEPGTDAYHAQCGDGEPSWVMASHKATLARLLAKTGNERKAKKVAREAVELSDTDEIRESLGEIL